jgi:hypothetical protein
MPAGEPFGAAWADAPGVTPAWTKGDGAALAGGETLGSGGGALGAGLAASTGAGASSKKAGSAQKKINRLSARSRPDEATLAPSHSLRIPDPGCDVISSIRRDRGVYPPGGGQDRKAQAGQ